MKFDGSREATELFECAAIDGEKLYFAEMYGNGVLCYDFITHETELLCEIHEEDEHGCRLFSSMVICERSIFLFPFSANHIFKINRETREYIALDLPEIRAEFCREYDSSAKFIDAHLYGEAIYVMPAAFPGILKVSCHSNEVSVYDEWLGQISLEFRDADKAVFRKTLLIGDKIYAPLCGGNGVAVFGLREGTCTVKEVGTRKCRFSGICYSQGEFWLSPRCDGPVVRWNESENIWQEYMGFPKDYIPASTSGIEMWNRQAIILPQASNMVVVVDCLNGTMKEWNSEYRDKNVVWYKKLGDSLLLCLGKEAGVIVIDEEKVASVKFLLSKSLQERYKKMLSATYRRLKSGEVKQAILMEDYATALEEYLNYIKKMNG